MRIRELLRGDALPKALFALSMLMFAFGYGVVAEHYNLFPVSLARRAKAAVELVLERSRATLPWYLYESEIRAPARLADAGAMAPGLTLVSGAAPPGTWIRVVDATGRVIHDWRPDWFRIWPHPEHIPEADRPKSNGPLVQGMAIMPDGDLVFNFESLSLVRLNACGDIVWKLPYQTHHSVHIDDRGYFWVPGRIQHQDRVTRLPNFEPPFWYDTVVEVSPAGHVVNEISVLDLLLQNGLQGLLHLSTRENRDTLVSGDTLHLNEVETFPTSLNPGVFQHGDVMISLRNINTIIVFDPRTLQIRFKTTGRVLRQHDPHFIDGNTISVLDNNNLLRPNEEYVGRHVSRLSSRIVTISAIDESVHARFEGTEEHPFFTDILGKHRMLPNGNIFITESVPGRVFEVDGNGRIIWEYFNIVREGVVGLIGDAKRLPPQYDEAFFARVSSSCRADPASN